MKMTTIEEIASSRVRLTIANLLSSRPRTLGELAETTGISVQGVLKHLKVISRSGILKTKSLAHGRFVRARKLYYIDTRRVADYSQEDMILATIGAEKVPGEVVAGEPYVELDRLAQDVILMKRRVRDLSERMRRMMEETTEDESRISHLIEGLALTPEERQIAYLLFGDDRPEKVRRILRQHYGCSSPDQAIEAVAEKLREVRV
jgi:predicted transcriptional regulator